MSELNEFEEAAQIGDLEFLKSLRPEWENDRLEPLTPPVEDSVVPPIWGKADLSNSTVPSVQANDAQPFELIQVIAGKENGGTFTPGLVNAIGPFVEL